MWELLGKINKNQVIAIPIMMVAGFSFGIFTDATFLKRSILPFTFLMVYPMMDNLKLRQVLDRGDGRGLVRKIHLESIRPC